MPSRVTTQATREDETSTTSSSPSYQSASPGLKSEDYALEDLRSRSRRRSQSIAAGETALSSSIIAEHHHSEGPTPLKAVPGLVALKSEKDQRPNSSPSSLQAPATQRSQPPTSYFVRQPRASGPDARSPSTRRAPASRSSHGIETLSGPPPALITQRSYTGDNLWRYTQPDEGGEARRQGSTVGSDFDSRNTSRPIATHGLDNTDPETSQQPNARMTSNGRARSGRNMEEDQDQVTLRGSDFPQSDGLINSNQPGNDRLDKQSQSSHEDLFLNLAQADTAAGGDSDRSYPKQQRRSRLSTSGIQLPAPNQPSNTRQLDYRGRAIPHQRPSSNREHQSPSWQGAYASQRDSPDSRINGNYKERSYASSAHPFDQKAPVSHSRLAPRASFNASRARRSSTRDPSPELPSLRSGRPYEANHSPDPPSVTFRQPDYLQTDSDHYNSSPLNGYSFLGQRQVGRRSSRADGTESTLSTNAPSMILEQLDELNSRIKKLELNGKMPSTSSAAMSSVLGERPATATTTMTTMSPSPKHGKIGGTSPEASTVKGPENPSARPLLHSALARCKGSINADTFRALETTASDALSLAAMTTDADTEIGTGDTENARRAVNQRLRHKANSMCRSLTELCIALSDLKSDTQSSSAKSPPESVDTATTVQPSQPLLIEKARSARATSVEPELRTSSRVMSRLEARRSSQVALNAQLGRRVSSPFESPGATPIVPSATASRASSVLLKRGTEEGELPTSRTLAITDTAPSQNRSSPQERTSREYTSQHPLPRSTQRSPSVQSSLPQRKSYFLNSNTSSPITPSAQPRDRRYLDLSTPPSSGSSRLAEVRQRREASQKLNSGLGGAARAGLLNIRTGAADFRRAP